MKEKQINTSPCTGHVQYASTRILGQDQVQEDDCLWINGLSHISVETMSSALSYMWMVMKQVMCKLCWNI